MPENAFMVLCLPKQSKWMLGIAIQADVYNRGCVRGQSMGFLSMVTFHIIRQLSTNNWESVNISKIAYPNLSMTNSGKWHVKKIYKLQNRSWKIKKDMNSAF